MNILQCFCLWHKNMYFTSESVSVLSDSVCTARVWCAHKCLCAQNVIKEDLYIYLCICIKVFVYLCKTYHSLLILQYSNANRCYTAIHFKREMTKTNKKPPSSFLGCIISKSLIWKCYHLHAGIVLAIYSLSKLQPISKIRAENKNPSHKNDLTCSLERAPQHPSKRR